MAMMDNAQKLKPSGHRIIWLSLGVWLVFVMFGYYQLNRYANREIAQHSAHWQQTLTLGVNYQQAQLQQYFRQQRQALQSLAQNTAFRLYLAAALQNDENGAELTYVTNYLLATAQQAGFTPTSRDIDRVAATLSGSPSAGIGVLNAKYRLIAGSSALPDSGEVRMLFGDTSLNKIRVVSAESVDGSPAIIAWQVPVYAVQATQGEDAPLGYLLATSLASRAMEAAVLPTLEAASLVEVALFQRQEKDEYQLIASPERSLLALSRGAFLAALEHPSEFSVTALVRGAPDWYIWHQVDESKALFAVHARLRWLRIAYWLMAITFTLVAMLLWRNVMAQHLQQLLTKISVHEQLLHTVLNALPARIFIVDRHRRYHFANKAAATEANMLSSEMIGKTTENVMGRGMSQHYDPSVAVTIAQQEAFQQWDEYEQDGQLQAQARKFIPLASLPNVEEEALPAVLVMESDMTSLVQAQKARQKMQEKLIDTLVMLADQRDAHTSLHSQRVAILSQGIAQAMQLSDQDQELLAITARLMNLGKLLVPEQLLTKEAKLVKKDRTIFDLSHQTLIQYLGDIPFPFPVVETLRAIYQPENEVATPLPSTILKVANSFVALTSPRAYRDALSQEEAVIELEKDRNELAQKVVVALRHYLVNLVRE